MKLTSVILSLLFFLTPLKQIDKVFYKEIAGVNIYDIKNKSAYIFSAGMQIDADGAPKAYHIDNKKALDNLSNAGKPGKWWALVTDNGRESGKPLIQKATDPAPGFYISMTSLEDDSKQASDPNRYVNSETTSYFVLPKNLLSDFQLGDIALVVNTRNNKRTFAIFADYGPPKKIGEGSIHLAKNLGINSSPKIGGIEDGITYIPFKNSGTNRILNDAEIQLRGKNLISDSTINELLK